MIYTIFIIPLIVIISGYFMYRHPPKKINYFIGYRTIKSMKNDKVWEFANKYCGKLWIKLAIVMIIISTILFALIGLGLFEFTENILGIIIICEIFSILLSILIVENKIKT